jgi:hypothetical protein
MNAGCAAAKGNSFVQTGRGGIPKNPAQRSTLSRPWPDLRQSLGGSFPSAQSVDLPKPIAQLPHLIEATALSRNPHTGELALIDGNVSHPIDPATCGLR